MIYIASRNPGKIREFTAQLAGHSIRAAPDHVEFPEENGVTYAENALAKARACYDQTGVASIGDDSGIAVEYLDGRPGVWSARFADDNATDVENLEYMVRMMAPALFPSDRRATFAVVLVYVHGDVEITRTGLLHGRLARQPRGGQGFGYDPIFIPDESDGTRTMAEMDASTKAIYSHRARAASALQETIRSRARAQRKRDRALASFDWTLRHG